MHYPRTIGAILAALVVALCAQLGQPQAVAGTATPAPLPACSLEDGSAPDQVFPCRWNASTQGNGQGRSYILTMPVCSGAEIAMADEAHAQGLPPADLGCDDWESLTGDWS